MGQDSKFHSVDECFFIFISLSICLSRNQMKRNKMCWCCISWGIWVRGNTYMWNRFKMSFAYESEMIRLTHNLLQSVKRDRYILQLACLFDEVEHCITSRHAPQLLVYLWPMAVEIFHSTFSYNLKKGEKKEKHWPQRDEKVKNISSYFCYVVIPTHGGKYSLGSK